MRKVYSSNTTYKHNLANRIIDVVLYFQDTQISQIAAARVSHPLNLPEKERYSETQLNLYNTFLDNVANLIVANGFKIDEKKTGQSKRSYAYYFHFNVPFQDKLLDWTIRMRIADHKAKGRFQRDEADTEEQYDLGKTILRSIIIGKGKEFYNTTHALMCIDYILEGLKIGDFNRLDIDYTSDDPGEPDLFTK